MPPSQILITEDESGLRLVLSEVLTDEGFNVSEAADGLAAMEILQATPSIELIISDVRMPQMSGYELVETALKLRPELKVLMMTAYPEDRPSPAALKAREIRTLFKPFNIDRLATIVMDMVSRPT
jgi:DNA-binding NtrC family response regulator